jgi:hypothetical protein
LPFLFLPQLLQNHRGEFDLSGDPAAGCPSQTSQPW